MEMTHSKKTMIWSLCAALCVALPQIMRIIPGADIVYRAMYIPVLLCGTLCGPLSGLLCALTGSCVSAFVSGSPTAAMFPVVLAELAVMGLASGTFMGKYRKTKGKAGLVKGLVLAVMLGVMTGGFIAAIIFSPGRGSMVLWVWGYVMAGIPAMVVQLVLIPTVFKALEYSGVLSLYEEDSAEKPTGETAASTEAENDEGKKSAPASEDPETTDPERPSEEKID